MRDFCYCRPSRLAWKQLQIDTDMLLIIRSSADELFVGGSNIDDLERPWSPKIAGFSELFAISGCDAYHSLTKGSYCIIPRVQNHYALSLGCIMKKIMATYVKWRPSWTPSYISQNAQGDQGLPGRFWKWVTRATQNRCEKTIPGISRFNPISAGLTLNVPLTIKPL